MVNLLSSTFSRKHADLIDVSTPHATADIADSAITTAKIADSAVTPAKLSFGCWEKVADITVEGSAVTDIVVDGLDLDTHRAYMIIFKVKNPTANSSGMHIFFNDDTNDANYYQQYLYVSGTDISANRANNSIFTWVINGKENNTWGLLTRGPTGIPKFHALNIREGGSTVSIEIRHVSWTTSANVTKIQIHSDQADAISVGSNLMIFKVSK